MKSYKDNQNAKEVHYQETLREKKQAALQKNLAKKLKKNLIGVAEALSPDNKMNLLLLLRKSKKLKNLQLRATTETSTNQQKGHKEESEDHKGSSQKC